MSQDLRTSRLATPMRAPFPFRSVSCLDQLPTTAGAGMYRARWRARALLGELPFPYCVQTTCLSDSESVEWQLRWASGAVARARI
mmetsp:Transcript_12843/g.41987  ORF Transcript_12843/g.41987 Transcript_12843/m.41987 type:complete len:85 (-) Transcript_12843:642-896(-)